MKRLGENEAKTREEMICPNSDCLNEGLEAASIASEWSGDIAIIRGTRCPNPDCKYHKKVPEKEIKRQYVPQPLHKKIIKYLKPKEITPPQVLPLAFIVLAVGVVALLAVGLNPVQLGINAFSVEKNVSGQVTGPDGTPIQDADVFINDSSKLAKTDNNGEYLLTNVSGGRHEVVIEPQNKSLGKQSIFIDVSEDNVQTYDVTGENISNQGTATVQLYKIETYSDEETLNRNYTDSFVVAHEQNHQDYNISIDIPSETQSYTEQIQGKRTGVNINGEPNGNGNVQIQFNGTEQTQSKTIQHTSQQSEFTINGNKKPEQIQITDITFEAEEETQSISSNTNSETVSPNNEPQSNLLFTPTQTEATAERTVIYNDITLSNPTIVSKNDNEQFSSVKVYGETNTTQRTIQRTTSETQLSHQLTANKEIQQASITVNNIIQNSSQSYSDSISASSDETEKRKTKEIYTATTNTTITISTNITDKTNPDGVTGGYYKNDNFVKSNGTTEVSVNKSDNVGVWIQTESENINHTYQHDGSFRVEKTELSRKQVEPGESVGVRAEIRNPTDEAKTETIRLFKDSNEVETETVKLGPQSTELVTIGRTTLETEKVYQINVNNGSPKYVQVGGATENRAKGTVTGTVTVQTESESAVTFDFENTNCELKSGETCRINTSSQFISSDISYRNADEVTYTIEYTAVNNTKGVVIMDNVGRIIYSNKDILLSENNPLILENIETESDKLFIQSYNGNGSISTDIKQEGVLENATVTVNGETVYNDNITVEESINLGEISQDKSYTVTVEADNEYKGTLLWNETIENKPDSLEINNNPTCRESIENCDITAQSELGTNEVQFRNFTGSLTYSVKYNEKYISKKATVRTSTSEKKEVFNTDQTVNWSTTTTVPLQQNTSEIIIEANENTSISGQLNYTSTAPTANEVTVYLNGEPYETISTERTETKFTSIESTDLQKGKNTVTVVGDRNGIYTVGVTRNTDYKSN